MNFAWRTVEIRWMLVGTGATMSILLMVTLAVSLRSGCDDHEIRGRVTSADDGESLYAELLLFVGSDLRTPAQVVGTDAEGFYSMRVRSEGVFSLVALPESGSSVSGYRLRGHMPQLVRVEFSGNQALVVRDFRLEPCHDFVLEAYAPDGSPVSHEEWPAYGFPVDESGRATSETYSPISQDGHSSRCRCVHVPAGQRRTFYQQWLVPGFGNIVLSIDNAGMGYSSPNPGGTVLNFNFELAKTQVHRLKTNLAEYQGRGYPIPVEVRRQARETEGLLARAGAAVGAQMAFLANDATAVALHALESLELAKSEHDIERNRKGSVALTILNAEGEPVTGASVEYRQVSHDFLFGIAGSVHLAPPQGYQLMRAAGVNYATLMFYWDWTEHEESRFDWDWIDHGIGAVDLHRMGFKLKAHALQSLWPWGNPDYLKGLSSDFPAFRKKTYEHISALVSRYRDRVDIWNVINEAHFRGGALSFDRDQMTILTDTGVAAIAEHDPESRVIVECMFDWFGQSKRAWPGDDLTVSIPDYFRQLDEAGVKYDIIGQQLYNGGLIRFFADYKGGELLGVPTWDLEHLSSVLDQLCELGKPVHVTEQSVPSSWNDEWLQYGAGWWHRPWDEDLQAEFLRAFYTVAFSKASVEAVSWWNISDTRLNLIHTGGLMTADGRPKKAFHALKDVIQGWTTAGASVSDGVGVVELNGFGGDYELTITHDGRTWRRQVHIRERERQLITIRVGTT